MTATIKIDMQLLKSMAAKEEPVSEKKIKKGEAIFLYDDLKKSLKKTHKTLTN